MWFFCFYFVVVHKSADDAVETNESGLVEPEGFGLCACCHARLGARVMDAWDEGGGS